MKIMLVIQLVTALCAACLAMRYNMHMFQLNGYKNTEHISWMKKNIRKQGLLLAGFLAGLLAAVFPHGVTAFILLICTLVTIWYYRLLKRNNTKKKLVYTNRIKRLIMTDTVLSLLVMLLLYLTGGIKGLWISCGLVPFIQQFLLMPANTVNSPIERA